MSYEYFYGNDECDYGYCDEPGMGQAHMPRFAARQAGSARAELPKTGSLQVNITPYVGNPTLTLRRCPRGPIISLRPGTPPPECTTVGSVKSSGLAKRPRRWAGLPSGWYSLSVSAPGRVTRRVMFYWAGDKTMNVALGQALRRDKR